MDHLILLSIGFVFWTVCYLAILGELAIMSVQRPVAKPEWPFLGLGGSVLLSLPVCYYFGGSDALFLWMLGGVVVVPWLALRWVTPVVVNARVPIRSRIWLPVLALGWLALDANLEYTERQIAKSLRALGWHESSVWFDVWRWLPQSLAVLMMAWLCLDAAIFMWQEARARSSARSV